MSEEAHTATPEQAPQDTMLEGYQKRSFIFGLISVLTSVWAAPVGLGLGIAGLVQTSKARKRSVALQDTPPRRFMPQFVLSLIGTIVSSITIVVVGFTLIAGLSTLVPVLENTFKGNTEYPKAVETLEGAKKNFSVGETVQFGPFDITIRDIQKQYTPLSTEVASPKEGDVYTKFTADVSYNAERGKTYDRLLMDVRSWGDALGRLELDGTLCGVYPTIRELEKYNATYEDGYKNSTTITYLCKGETATPQEATLDVSLFSKVSPIVGTEGMPRKNVTYSVQF